MSLLNPPSEKGGGGGRGQERFHGGETVQVDLERWGEFQKVEKEAEEKVGNSGNKCREKILWGLEKIR